MTVCRHAFYTGCVQGVGFRYTAQHLADQFAVTGYVRNLPDGRVELLAEGSAEKVDHFLGAVAQRMAGYIEQTRVDEEPPQGARGFHIRY